MVLPLSASSFNCINTLLEALTLVITALALLRVVGVVKSSTIVTTPMPIASYTLVNVVGIGVLTANDEAVPAVVSVTS